MEQLKFLPILSIVRISKKSTINLINTKKDPSMKKYISVAFLTLLASPMIQASENQVKNGSDQNDSDQREKEICFKSIFDGKLENVTASRSLWTMLTNPTKAYFFQSPENAYIQCLKKHPKARELVTHKIDTVEDDPRSKYNRWKSVESVSATIGNTVIEELNTDNLRAKRISQVIKTIDPESIATGVKRETANKLYLINRWQQVVKIEELRAQIEELRAQIRSYTKAAAQIQPRSA